MLKIKSISIFVLMLTLGSVQAQEKSIDLGINLQTFNYLKSGGFPALGVAYKNNHNNKVLIRVQFDYGWSKSRSPLFDFPNLTAVPTDIAMDEQQCYALTAYFGYNFLGFESNGRLYLSTGLGFRAYQFDYWHQVYAENKTFSSAERTDTTAVPMPFLPLELRYELVVDRRIGLNFYAGFRFAISDRKETLIRQDYKDLYSGIGSGSENFIQDEPYIGFGMSFYFRDIPQRATVSAPTRKRSGSKYEIWW